MEPAHLLPLLASLQMLPWPVSPEASLPAPELTVSPQYRVFLSGESVTLTCSTPSTDTVYGIRFFRDGKRIGSGELQQSQSNAKLLELSRVSESDTGEYSCEYWETESDRESPSERSQTIFITVTAWPPALDLSLSPQYRVILRGESVTLTCSAPRTDTVSRIRFFRDGQEIDSGELQPYPSKARSHQLLSVSKADAGAYSCESWKKESGREIPSERSQTISITVTARPPAPELTVSPKYRVFLRWESVTLTCSAPSTDTASGIRFFRDGQSINSRDLQWSPYNVRSLQLSRVSESHAGVYSCDYLKTESGREIPSERSQTISITVTASLPVPQISVSPSQPVYIMGEDVTLTCSADGSPTVSGIRFYRNSQEIQSKELPSPRTSHIKSLPLSSVSAGSAGQYSCESWKTVFGREIKSVRSKSCSIRVTDPPSQPKLSVDPPSGVVSEGFSLNITCTVPKDARERRFYFYKDGVELIPGDLGSKISTMEPSTSSVKGSVLSIPWAGSNITGEFTCGYEENVAGRWILSPRSWTVNVTGNITMSVSAAHDFRWVREVAVGGSFFLINGLIVHVSYRCF